MWCKGENELEAQFNNERYLDSRYKGKTLYETGVCVFDSAKKYLENPKSK
jgi:hypothetical protein